MRTRILNTIPAIVAVVALAVPAAASAITESQAITLGANYANQACASNPGWPFVCFRDWTHAYYSGVNQPGRIEWTTVTSEGLYYEGISRTGTVCLQEGFGPNGGNPLSAVRFNPPC